ncbi:MAG: GNAT family N-acetyltransferase [Acidobacteria bacterium]|nr:GNAT family N-acetyltransferase [Acidobacteriota bacterium]
MSAMAARRHLAHAPEWATIIARAYGHAPLYLSAEDERHPGVLPAFIVRRPLVGTIVSSMPFLDGGGPACESPGTARHLVDRLVDHARLIGARMVELRCAAALDEAWTPRQHKVNLTLALPSDPAALWSGFDRSVRNQVRKAERSGLRAAREDRSALPALYDAYAERMRELGSPPHAPAFFRAVADLFDTRARLVTVRKDGAPIGGLIAIAHGDTLTVPWASCRSAYRSLCPNMLLYWETLRAACADGFRRFDFGRSTRGSGTWRFKRQWGTVEEPLFWYQVPLDGRAPDVAAGGAAGRLSACWRRLPLGLTRRLGPSLRRYLVQ